METIKEKVMRAWGTDAVVRIQMQSGRCFEGLIGNAFSEIGGKLAVLLTSYNDEGEVTNHRHLPYEDITDIRFVGEGVSLADYGSIMGDFQKERTAALSEMFDNPDPETSIYPTIAFYARLDRAVQKALDRQRHAMQSTIMPETGDESVETESGPPADDMAKERWIYSPEKACVNPDTEGLPAALFGKSYGTDEQMFVAAAAPEMLDALEKIRDRVDSTLGKVQISMAHSVWEGVLKVIEKAEGSHNEKNEATEDTPAE